MATHQSSALPHSSTPALDALAQNWWLLLLRGAAAIVFGILAFVWPQVTLFTLILLFGAYVLVDGFLSLFAAITGKGGPSSGWWLAIAGLIGIAAGLVTFFWPGVTAILLVLYIGAWSLFRGIFELIGAVQMRDGFGVEWLLFISGAISVLFGLTVLLMPGAGALAVVWLIAIYAIAFGILNVALAFRLRERHLHTAAL
jgi:uncharacterized membrane protein HdeD (DUF308 family)